MKTTRWQGCDQAGRKGAAAADKRAGGGHRLRPRIASLPSAPLPLNPALLLLRLPLLPPCPRRLLLSVGTPPPSSCALAAHAPATMGSTPQRDNNKTSKIRKHTGAEENEEGGDISASTSGAAAISTLGSYTAHAAASVSRPRHSHHLYAQWLDH